MAKGLLFIALAACMVASGQPLLSILNPLLNTVVTLPNTILQPITGVVTGLTNTVGDTVGTVGNTVGTVTNTVGTLTNVTGSLTGSLGAVTGIVGSLTGTVTNLTGGLTGTVNNLLNPVLQIVTSLTGTALGLTNTINVGGLADTVGKTLETAVSVPLNVVTGLAGSITGSLNPNNLTSGITGALKPILDALTSVTNQLNGTGAVGCLLNSATGLIKGAVLTSVGEVLVCANPVTNVVNNITKQITNITTNGVNFFNQIQGKATNCLQQAATSGNLGGTVGCVINPVTQSVSFVTNTLSAATPLVSNTLSSALQIPTCLTNVLTKTLNRTTQSLNEIVQCALGKGVNVTLPTIPSVVPNFTTVANEAIFSLEDLYKNVLGPNGEINKLLGTVDKLKEVTSILIPNAVNSVNTTLNSVQDVINSALMSANGNSAALSCVSTAQKSLNDQSPSVVKNVVDCAANLANKTASIVAQAAALDLLLKTELLSVAANGYIKCNSLTGAMDNSAANCFKSFVAEIQAYIKSQNDKINTAIGTAQSLIDTTQTCLSSGVSNANKVAQVIIDQLKTCLAAQAVIVKPEDITSVVVAGKAAVEKTAAGLSAQVNIVSNIVASVQGSHEFIASIDKAAVENVILGSVSGVQSAVLQVEASLKNNTNPAVKACIDATKDKVSKLEPAAVSTALACVANNKQKAEALVAQIKALVNTLIGKLANAGVKAQQDCSSSATVAIAQKCFVDAQVNLEADANQTVDKVQSESIKVQETVNDAIKCVNDASAAVTKAAFDELDVFSSCLAAQGVSVKFTRN